MARESNFDDEGVVDWEINEVNSRAEQRSEENHTGLGDPTRWGSDEPITVGAPDVLAWSPQLVRVQAEDAYPRNWQLIGTLSITSEMLSSVTADLEWFAVLELTMGIGQGVVRHLVNLRALLDLASDPALYATGNPWYLPIDQGGSEAIMPWILPGGITARSVQARVGIIILGDTPIVVPTTRRIACAISPYAVGHHL